MTLQKMKKENAWTRFKHLGFVAASVSRSVEDVQFIRKTLGPQSRSIRIISMIKDEEGVKDRDATIQESDGIIEVRVDKSTEIFTREVVLAQMVLIAKCNVLGDRWSLPC